MVSSERSLDVIYVRGKRENPQGLPSWAPNFQLFGVEHGSTTLVDASGKINIFRASLNELYVDLEPTNQRIEVLNATGLCLGMMEGISPRPNTTLELIFSWIATTQQGPDKKRTEIAQRLC